MTQLGGTRFVVLDPKGQERRGFNVDLRYSGGRLGALPAATAHEVAEVRWLPLGEAPRLLAYRGEREMAQKALAFLAEHAL